MRWSASRWSRTPSAVTAFVSLATVLLLGDACAETAVDAPMSAVAAVVALSARSALLIGCDSKPDEPAMRSFPSHRVDAGPRGVDGLAHLDARSAAREACVLCRRPSG